MLSTVGLAFTALSMYLPTSKLSCTQSGRSCQLCGKFEPYQDVAGQNNAESEGLIFDTFVNAFDDDEDV